MGVETLAAVGVPLAMAAISKAMSSGGDSGVNAANASKLQLMGQAQKDLGAYRPQLMQAEMGAMNRRLGAYHGAQDALATMYGGGKPAAPMGVLPSPSVLGQGPRVLGAMGGPAGAQSNLGMPGRPNGPIPMPSAPQPPQMGNGPPMGSPNGGLPSPSAFLGKKPY